MNKDDILNVLSHFSWHFKFAYDEGKDWYDAWDVAMNKTMNSEELITEGVGVCRGSIQTLNPKTGRWVKLKEEKKPRYIQLLHPRTNRYTKFDTVEGGIVSHKKSPGPYKNIPIYKYRKPKPVSAEKLLKNLKGEI